MKIQPIQNVVEGKLSERATISSFIVSFPESVYITDTYSFSIFKSGYLMGISACSWMALEESRGSGTPSWIVDLACFCSIFMQSIWNRTSSNPYWSLDLHEVFSNQFSYPANCTTPHSKKAGLCNERRTHRLSFERDRAYFFEATKQLKETTRHRFVYRTLRVETDAERWFYSPSNTCRLCINLRQIRIARRYSVLHRATEVVQRHESIIFTICPLNHKASLP